MALNSHTGKTFARILLNRMGDKLDIRGGAQQPCRKRQAAEYIWSIVHATQLSYEWAQSMALIKLDIAKAFDAVDRQQLGKKLVETLAPAHPSEVKCLLSMLGQGRAVIRTDWGETSIAMTSGVKQGAVESPTIFAWIMDLVTLQVDRTAPVSSWFPDIGVNKLSFMDDMLLWDGDVPSLQLQVSSVCDELFAWGLRVNLAKSSLVTWGDTQGRQIRLGPDVLDALENGHALHVMGVPVLPGLSPSEHMAALIAKARACFHSNYQVLRSNAAIHDRVRLLQKIVWAAMAWAAGTVMPTQTITNMLNAFQWDCISSMAKFRRRSDELFVDFRMRSCRASRAILHASGCERWGTLQIRMFWRFAGHRARGCANVEGGSPSAATLFTHARNLQWWTRQQQLVGGRRHGRRHFARLMGEERELSAVACEGEESWQEVALNRARWKGWREHGCWPKTEIGRRGDNSACRMGVCSRFMSLPCSRVTLENRRIGPRSVW